MKQCYRKGWVFDKNCNLFQLREKEQDLDTNKKECVCVHAYKQERERLRPTLSVELKTFI